MITCDRNSPYVNILDMSAPSPPQPHDGRKMQPPFTRSLEWKLTEFGIVNGNAKNKFRLRRQCHIH